MRTRRRAVACATLALLTVGCERRAGPSGEAIVVLHPSEERVLGPVWDDTPKFLMFLPLVNYERGSFCGEPTPALAEHWEHSTDYRTWTVRLRENVRWHDGVPVTAGDIKFTVDLLKHPDVLNYNASAVDSVEVLDERTVRIVLKKPGRWPLKGWATFYPRHLLEELDPAEFYEWDFWTRPVGNGPFRYVRHVPQTMMELEANPEYHLGRPRIDRVVLRFVTGGSGSGLLEMRSGNADLTSSLSLLEAKQLDQEARFRVHYRVSTSHASWLAYNPRRAMFQDERVRRALTQAVDRRALHAALDLPADLPLTDAPYTLCQFARGGLAEPWTHDPVAAAGLLEAAGWRDENGDGVRERNGEGFRFMTLVPAQEERAALVLQDQLRRVGVRMEVRSLNGNLILDRIRGGDFEAAIPPSWGIQPILTSTPVGPDRLNDVFQQAYPSIVGLLDTADQEPDFTERERQYRELAREFRRQLPATYLYPRVYPIVTHRRIHGFDHDGWTPPAWRWVFGGLEWLWVEEGG